MPIRQMSVPGRVAVLKALADDTRFKIARALLEAPQCTEELAARLKRSPGTISFHLRKLDEAGLVSKHKTQYYLMYSLRTEILELPLAAFIQPTTEGKTAEQQRLKQFRQKVIRAFFKNGRLTQMPKQWRKQRIVLEEILPAFQEGRTYDESEVNERIHAFADDHCLIRRMMIEEQLLTRSGQDYRRVSKETPQMTSNPTASSIDEHTSKKDAKRAYLEAPRQAGIFRITNQKNGRVYLGSSLNLHGPLNKHQFTLSIGAHINKAMQADWKKDGEESFAFEVVEVIAPSDKPGFNIEDELSLLEDIWIEKEQIFTNPGRAYNRRKKIRE